MNTCIYTSIRLFVNSSKSLRSSQLGQWLIKPVVCLTTMYNASQLSGLTSILNGLICLD